MILDSPYISGSMSFGIANPSATMHISASTGAVLRVDGAGVTNTGSLFVSSSGNVGIGTAIPTSKLQVEGGTLRIGDGAGGWSGFTFSSTLRQANNNNVTLLGGLQVDSTAGATSYISRSLAINKTTANATFDVSGSALISGSINATGPITGSGFFTAGNITAQTLIVQTISSSIEFVTGSTKFGSLATNTHQFTGSVSVNPGGLFVSSSGLVGIGTTSPANYLHINGLGPNLIIQNTSSSVGSEATITFRSTFGNGNIAYLGYIRAIQQSTSINTGDIAIHAYSAGSANEVIRIQGSSGNIGIGTTSPNHQLTVYSSVRNSTTAINAGNSNTIPSISIQSDATTWADATNGFAFIYNADNGNLDLYRKQGSTTQNQVMTWVRSNGNVGIGTSSPSRLLNISGAGNSGTQMQINGTADSAGIKFIPVSGDNWEVQANISNQWFVYNRTDEAYRFLIDGSGNVGIGITPQGAGSAKTLEIGSRGIIYDNNDNFLYGNNGWVDGGTWKYKQTGYACILATNGGQFTFSTAASGTQNAAITWSDKFVIANNGNVTVNGTLTESSSIRYKTNIETIKYGLDKVLQLRGVTYDKKDTGIKELGLIAEEVNEILPDVVIKNEEGEPDSVSYGRITAVLIEAVKDLQSQINELKAK
jgi:hypothetical protein